MKEMKVKNEEKAGGDEQVHIFISLLCLLCDSGSSWCILSLWGHFSLLAPVDLNQYVHSPVHRAVVMKDYACLRKILSGLPRSDFPAMGCVCRPWRSFMQSKEFITVRRLAGLLEEWLYVLTMDGEGKGSH
ncbi:F-box/kelch-repeat protein [Camellia lanceoleosa]|uniref:F-box/kelch-repeat protein n=1 Tax=Camellia lanceoleosa TaxID=1840588 RepID=A0ACC0GM25_9ERIC|nr:F-box/kelch-repeat protein [Camellia lanceoleosa]